MKLANWKTLSSEVVLERPPWLRVLSEDIELADNRVVEGYLRLEAPDFVMMAAINQKQEMGFIRSYKHGLKGVDVQPPAGYIGDREDPLDAAKRELLEETGCISPDWHSLGSYVISGNQGFGKAYFFVAKACDPVADPNPGDLETQEVLWIPIPEVKTMWASGQFLQLSSIAILGLAFKYLQ